MLISLHLPKTAGSSFAASLKDHFGEKLKKDYSDLPLHKSAPQRNSNALYHSVRNHFINDFLVNNTECIHGHFLPLKYRFIKGQHSYITWMRDPAERLASQYYYMQRTYSPENAEKQSLLKKVIENNWSLERFCLGPELQNTYSKFLWGFPITSFSFIGIMEEYENELSFFSEKILKSELAPYKKNSNFNSATSNYFDKNTSLRKKIVVHHSKDYELYETALRIKQSRLLTM